MKRCAVTIGMGLLAVAFGLCWTACGGKGGGGGGGTAGVDDVIEWHKPDHPYRVMITLNPHPDRDRTDVPVLAELSHPGAHILRDVRIYARQQDGDFEPTEGAAWSQPDGTVLEVGFTAEGPTPAGETRLFLVYYRTGSSPDVWAWSDGQWAAFSMLDKDSNSVDDGFNFSGGGYEIQRDINENDGTIRRYRRDDGNTFLKVTGPDWTVAEGFSNSYQLEDHSTTYDPQSVEGEPHTRIDLDVDAEGLSAAMGVGWEGRAVPVDHDVYMTHRVFDRFPFMELVISATMAQRPEEFMFSNAAYNGRLVYLTDGYDRMVSDTRGDEALEKVWDTSMRWLVVYDSATDRGFGWFAFARGVVRAADDGGEVAIYDSYGYCAAGRTVWRYLWMASLSKDEIVDLFDAMKPGVTIGPPENRDLNIVNPRPDDYYFPEDTLEVVVTTPGNRQPVTARITLSDSSEIDVELDNSENPLVHRWVSPLLLDASHPTGTWTVTAESDGALEQVDIQFRLPDHPKLMFGPADLPEIVARKDDPAYAEIWSEMLRWAGNYDPPIEDPAVGIDIRSYADRLMNLALIQLVDPSQPFDDLMWDYFFSMLRYPNWYDHDNPFNNHDLTVGHFLTALALTYDWHYDRMTPDERLEVREHLTAVTDGWVQSSWMRIYRDIDWTRYGSVTNNHYWINHQGVAAAAFVLADEMNDDRRSVWVNHLEENLSIILSVLEPDGGSNEGVAYHAYGQINLFRWLDMRDRALGGNTAEVIPWFRESVLFDLYSIVPGGDDNYGGVANFGDCPPRHYQPPRTIQAWLAGRLNDGIAQWGAESLQWPYFTAMSYLWYDPSIQATDPHTLPTWRLFPNKGIFTWRSSWENDATYFSLKSGSYFGGHEQPDAGHFILHRAGVPYITDHGYSYLKYADEHNLILFDGVGQYGEGRQWMESVDPVHWAEVESVLADEAYFDLVSNPSPMVLYPNLEYWHREVVGLNPGVWFVRDTVSATATVSMDWLLHSYRSDPPSSERSTYTYTDRRTENPFTDVAVRRWDVTPQDTAQVLHVADVSLMDWAAVTEPSNYVPETHPDTHEYNSTQDYFQVGFRLRRTVSADQASSVVVLWFDDNLSVENLSTQQAEAARVYDGGGDVAHVIWPSSGSVSGFNGFDLTGRMGGRRFDRPAYFGRGVTLLSDGAEVLIQATVSTDVFARLEHAFSASDPGVVVVEAGAGTDLNLLCPTSPTQVMMDGAPVAFSWAGSVLTLTVPAGTHRFEVL